MTATAFLAGDGGQGGRMGYVGHVDEVERLVPAGVVLSGGARGASQRTRFERLDVVKSFLEFALGANDADLGLHHVAHLIVDSTWVFATVTQEWCQHVINGLTNLGVINGGLRQIFGALGSEFSGSLTKHDEVGERVSAQSVGAVKARCHLTASEEAGDRRFLRFCVNDDATHDVVGGRTHLHGFLADVNTGQFLELMMHGREFLHDGFLTAMRNVEESASVGRTTAGFDLFVDGLGHHVSGQEFWRSSNRCQLSADHFLDPLVGFLNGVGVVASKHFRHVVKHESATLVVGEATAFTTNALGHEDTSYRRRPDHPSGVELNKLHVSKFCTGPKSEGMTVACVFPRARANRPTAGDAARGKNDRFGGEGVEIPVDPGVGDASGNAVPLLEQAANRVFHEDVNAFVNTSFLERSDDFEAGGIADVGKPREGVATEISLIDEVLGGAIKDGTPLFEFTDPVRGFFGVELGHTPVGEPFAPLHRVVEVNLPSVSGVSVLVGCGAPTLGHDGVGFAEQRLRDDGGFRSASGRLNGRSETSTTCADDNDIVFVFGYVFAHHLTSNHKQHHVVQSAFSHGQHPKVAKENKHQRCPKPKAMRTVEDADFSEKLPTNSADACGPAVEHATRQMTEGVTGGDVHREQEGLNAHHKGPDGNAVAVIGGGVKVHGVRHVPPLDDEDDHGGIEEVAVEVVEDEETLFAFVADGLVDVGLIHPARRGAGKEGAVIHSAHVIAGTSETEWNPEHEDSGVHPFGVVPLVQSEQVPFQNIG